MNVLLIEDNPDHAFLIRDMFDEQFTSDDSLTNIKTLKQGLAKLAEESFDICLCDLSLPDSSIENTMATLQEADTDAPIVVLTTLDDIEIESTLIQNGIQDYIPKNDLSPGLLHRICRHAIERKKLNKKIEELSVKDPLTGLYNRREFDRLLSLQLSTVKRHPAPLSLCLIDVDNFKQVNDELGHYSGDRALQLVSEAITSSIRETDIACRFGGDEFVLLLTQTGAQDSVSCAERIRAYMHEHSLQVEQRPLRVTLSVGIAEYLPEMSPKDLFELTDKALYKSKAAGRDCINVHTAAL